MGDCRFCDGTGMVCDDCGGSMSCWVTCGSGCGDFCSMLVMADDPPEVQALANESCWARHYQKTKHVWTAVSGRRSRALAVTRTARCR